MMLFPAGSLMRTAKSCGDGWNESAAKKLLIGIVIRGVC